MFFSRLCKLRLKRLSEFGSTQIHLVSVWGSEDGEVLNYHAGIIIEEENGVAFFKKTDPILPFQLSRFASVDEVKAHLLSRGGG